MARPRKQLNVAGGDTTGGSVGIESVDSGNGDTGGNVNDAAIDPGTVGAEFDGSRGGSGDSGSGSDSGSGQPVRRKRKYTRRKSAASAPGVSVDVMSALLLTGHSMLAGITKTPELALEESEAGELANALNTVNNFYRVEVAEKTMAWLNLAMVGGMIYGTRLLAIRERRSSTRAERVAARRTFTPNEPAAPGPIPDIDRPVNDAPPPPDIEIAEPPETFVPGDFGAYPEGRFDFGQ